MTVKRIDLSRGEVVVSPLDPGIRRSYLGGLGVAALLMAGVPDLTVPALDPRLPLIISVGELTATGFPGANRCCFYGVSPLTGLCAASLLGGKFGPALARSGVFALVLENRAPEPSVLVLSHDGSPRVIARPDLWGLSVTETSARLVQDYGDVPMAIIGPAGELQVAIASVQGEQGHAAGRCGLGAVMGSKNLKAIIAGGHGKGTVAQPQALRSAIREANIAIHDSYYLQEIQGKIGTNHLITTINALEALPTANFRERSFARASEIAGERIAGEYVNGRSSCPNCAVHCRMHVSIDGEKLVAAEYETSWAFGPNNQIADYPLIARANALCNELGLDTISTGNVVAFYAEYTGTLGNPAGVLDLVRQIGLREGPGEILARGVRAAAAEYGVDYAMHVKGLELPAYDPRRLTGMALGYATANRGGCHGRAWTVGEEMGGSDFSGTELAEMVVRLQDNSSVTDSLIECSFLDGTIRPWYAPALSAVTGDEFDEASLSQIGKRIYTLERMMNVRRGVDADQDALPARITGGLVRPDVYQEAIAEFYRLRGWGADGRPTAATARQLGLEWLM